MSAVLMIVLISVMISNLIKLHNYNISKQSESNNQLPTDHEPIKCPDYDIYIVTPCNGNSIGPSLRFNTWNV